MGHFYFSMPTPCLKEFDPMNPKHVIWLRELTIGIKNMDVSMGHKMGSLMNKNPFNVKIPMEAFIDVHAGISIKYAGAVLEKKAWLP